MQDLHWHWSVGLLELNIGDQDLGLSLSGMDFYYKHCDLLSLRPESWSWKV